MACEPATYSVLVVIASLAGDTAGAYVLSKTPAAPTSSSGPAMRQPLVRQQGRPERVTVRRVTTFAFPLPSEAPTRSPLPPTGRSGSARSRSPGSPISSSTVRWSSTRGPSPTRRRRRSASTGPRIWGVTIWNGRGLGLRPCQQPARRDEPDHRGIHGGAPSIQRGASLPRDRPRTTSGSQRPRLPPR